MRSCPSSCTGCEVGGLELVELHEHRIVEIVVVVEHLLRFTTSHHLALPPSPSCSPLLAAPPDLTRRQAGPGEGITERNAHNPSPPPAPSCTSTALAAEGQIRGNGNSDKTATEILKPAVQWKP